MKSHADKNRYGTFRDGAPGALSRRAFLKAGGLWLAAPGALTPGWPGTAASGGDAGRQAPVLRVGLVTDVHHADKPPAGTRHYRQSVRKIREAVARFRDVKVDLAVELGDFIDAAERREVEMGYLERIEAEFARFPGERHHVLGNHCVWTLTKKEFLDRCGATRAHYSFDRRGFHFVILDACYRSDGVPYGRRNFTWTDTEIPAVQREWLARDLAATKLQSVVFVHQRLDVAGHYGVHSAPAVRRILEASGKKVLAVIQGHNHLNDLKEIGGIHYCTLAALVEGAGEAAGAHGFLEVYRGGALRVVGYRRMRSWNLGGERLLRRGRV